MRRSAKAFTLVELLVSMAVLAMLVLLMSRLFNSAAGVATSGNKHMDADAQARGLLDRMAVDFAQMVKRADVDYYLKSSANPQPGNDQLAFYSGVQGYSSSATSPMSLIAYRVDSQQQMTRMAKGLILNGVSPASSPSPTPAPLLFLPITIAGTWPAATDATADADYEAIAPYVFRFEYYYVLKSGAVSDTPWDTTASHTAVAGLQDIAAISVVISAIDPKSRVVVSDSQLTTLAGTMHDFAPTMKPGELVAQWQTAINTAPNIARAALGAIRSYERQFSVPRSL